MQGPWIGNYDPGRSGMPCWWAQAAAAVREVTPILVKMFAK
jgi:hypothetical protein